MEPTIHVRGYALCAFLSIGLLIYLGVLTSVIANANREPGLFLLYVGCGLVYVRAWWFSATKLEINSAEIRAASLFGLLPTRTYRFDELIAVQTREVSDGRAARIRLSFRGGRRLELTRHLSNFGSARTRVLERAKTIGLRESIVRSWRL